MKTLIKPKVCYIIDNLKLAGAEVHLFNLVKGMKEIGYKDLEVVSLSGEGEIHDWITGIGIPVHNFRMKSIRRPIFVYDLVRLSFYLIRTKPDIVHTYLDTANVFGVIAAKCSNVKTVMTSRRDLGVFRSSRVERFIGILSNHVDKVVCVCEAAARESVRREYLREEKIVVIHNGINIDNNLQQKHLKTDQVIFGNVAVANRKEKGHEDLIRAFALVTKVLPESKLKLIGDGPLLPSLKELAHNLNVFDKVLFCGKSTDVSSALNDVAVFVLPSHSEGISNALLEAMAMGIPAVVTNVGGNPDVVVNGETGLLVEAKNPEALAQGMINLSEDRNRLVHMGGKAKVRVAEYFEYGQMIKNYDRLYISTMSDKN